MNGFVDHVVSELISSHTRARDDFLKRHPVIAPNVVSPRLSGWCVFFTARREDDPELSMHEISLEWAALPEGERESFNRQALERKKKRLMT